MKPKLKLVVGQATHFLRWEYPYFENYFTLVDEARDDVTLFVFGPDVLASSATLPAAQRVAFLFPGFGFDPYHRLHQRDEALQVIKEHYALVFANPGPIEEVLKSSGKLAICPFSIDVDKISPTRFRQRIDSLLHVSADYPQKDWPRSREIMQRTGLRYEVFPPRAKLPEERTFFDKLPIKLASYWRRAKKKKRATNLPSIPVKWPLHFNTRYARHETVIKKFQQYDGFVHVAAEVQNGIDGKYTATLLNR